MNTFFPIRPHKAENLIKAVKAKGRNDLRSDNTFEASHTRYDDKGTNEVK